MTTTFTIIAIVLFLVVLGIRLYGRLSREDSLLINRKE